MKAPQRARAMAAVPVRLLRRLRFPFALIAALVSAAARGEADYRTRAAAVAQLPALPERLVLWLERASGPDGSGADVCVGLPPDAGGRDLDTAFSAMLASPGVRSIAFYWEERALAADLVAWGGGRAFGRPLPSIERLAAPAADTVRSFLAAAHAPLSPPVGARREANALLKRHAAAAPAVCVNLSPAESWLAAAVAVGLPEFRFLDLAAASPSASPPNVVAVAGWGLSLHERIALVAAADSYVGRLDMLGVAAVMSGRTAVILGENDASIVESRRDLLWLPTPSQDMAVAPRVEEFLQCHFRGEGDR